MVPVSDKGSETYVKTIENHTGTLEKRLVDEEPVLCSLIRVKIGFG